MTCIWYWLLGVFQGIIPDGYLRCCSWLPCANACVVAWPNWKIVTGVRSNKSTRSYCCYKQTWIDNYHPYEKYNSISFSEKGYAGHSFITGRRMNWSLRSYLVLIYIYRTKWVCSLAAAMLFKRIAAVCMIINPISPLTRNQHRNTNWQLQQLNQHLLISGEIGLLIDNII